MNIAPSQAFVESLETSRLISKHREMLNFALPRLSDTKRPTKYDVARNAELWLKRLPLADELERLNALLEESSSNSANVNELAILFQGGFRNFTLSLADAMDRAKTFHKHGLKDPSAALWAAAIESVAQVHKLPRFPRHKHLRLVVELQGENFAWALAASKRLLKLRVVAEANRPSH